MAKVNIKSEKITPFGGIYHASKAFYALSLDKVINGTLGVRSSTYNGYQWDEIMSAMSDVFLCGGSYSEDIIRTVDGNCRIFYIRAIHSASIYSRILSGLDNPILPSKLFGLHIVAVQRTQNCLESTLSSGAW